MASILDSLTDNLTITEYDDWLIFRQRLKELVRNEKIRRIAPMKSQRFGDADEWYLDPETGEIYVHGVPNAPVLPSWEKFDIVAHTQEPRPHPNDLSVIPIGKTSPLIAKGIKGLMDLLIRQGAVEVLVPMSMDSTEHWYKELQTGIVYRLIESADGNEIRWEHVPQQDLQKRIQ